MAGQDDASDRVAERRWPALLAGREPKSIIQAPRQRVHRERTTPWRLLAKQPARSVAVQGLPKLDRYDLNILAALQAHGRMTYQDLGARVGLSTSPCLQRVKRLESSGYITGYGARIDLQKLGTPTVVFTSVTLGSHAQADFHRFEAGIRDHAELVECHLVSGGFDYLLKFVTRSVQGYQALMEEILGRGIGIEKYFSYIVIKSPIVQRYTPVSLIRGGKEPG